MEGRLFFCCIFILTMHLVQSRVKKVQIPQPNKETKGSIINMIKPTTVSATELDLAFIMDTTGSMSSYIKTARQHIREIVEEIAASSQSDVRLALIEYRDHKLEERSFVTRTHDFTSSVSVMKSWLNKANAKGGGDRPEAVADALHQAKTLSWRQSATKISIMVSDAPPHGLVPSEDTSYPDGSPNGHDPMQIASDLAQKGVTLYVIGCEPAIVPYKDFFEALAYKTGGQYVPLSVPKLLVNAITGGAREEISLKNFESDVQQELQRASASGGPIDKQKIAASVFQKLKKANAKTTQLVLNNKALEGPSASAKSLAKLTSMAEVRGKFKKGKSPRSFGIRRSFSDRKPSLRHFGGGRLRPSFASSGGFSKMGSIGPVGRSGLSGKSRLFSRPDVVSDISRVSSSPSDTLSTVESKITLEQVNRMVEKGFSKLSKVKA